MQNPAKKTAMPTSKGDAATLPMAAIKIAAVAKQIARMYCGLKRSISHPSAMAPSVPPTWNIAVTTEAVASDTPVLLIRVGSQLDKRYITRRLEKNASQSN